MEAKKKRNNDEQEHAGVKTSFEFFKQDDKDGE